MIKHDLVVLKSCAKLAVSLEKQGRVHMSQNMSIVVHLGNMNGGCDTGKFDESVIDIAEETNVAIICAMDTQFG